MNLRSFLPAAFQALRRRAFVDVSGAYRWRIRHSNGHVLASSEAYSSKAAAEETAKNLARAAFFPFVIEEVRP